MCPPKPIGHDIEAHAHRTLDAGLGELDHAEGVLVLFAQVPHVGQARRDEADWSTRTLKLGHRFESASSMSRQRAALI